jgi:hypothetical protein
MAMVIFNLKSFISSNNSAPSSSLLNSLNIFIWVQVGFDTLLGIAVFFAITYLMDKKTSLK